MSLFRDEWSDERRRRIEREFQGTAQGVEFLASFSDPSADGKFRWRIYPSGALKRECAADTYVVYLNAPDDECGKLRHLALYWRRAAERAEADLERGRQWLLGRRPSMRWESERYGHRPAQHSPTALVPIAEAARAARVKLAEVTAAMLAHPDYRPPEPTAAEREREYMQYLAGVQGTVRTAREGAV